MLNTSPLQAEDLAVLSVLCPNATIVFGGSYALGEHIPETSDCDIYIVPHTLKDTRTIFYNKQKLKDFKNEIALNISLHIIPEMALKFDFYKITGEVIVNGKKDITRYFSADSRDALTQTNALKVGLLQLALSFNNKDGVALAKAGSRLVQLLAAKEDKGISQNMFSYSNSIFLTQMLRSLNEDEEKLLTTLFLERLNKSPQFQYDRWKCIANHMLKYAVESKNTSLWQQNMLYRAMLVSNRRWQHVLKDLNKEYVDSAIAMVTYQLYKDVDKNVNSRYYLKRCLEKCAFFEDIPESVDKEKAEDWGLQVLQKYCTLLFVI